MNASHVSISVCSCPGGSDVAWWRTAGQSAGLVPGGCLFSKVFDAVGVGVGGVGFLHGGFPALVLYLSGLLVCKAFTLRGFAAEADLLHDLDELFFQRPVGEVGPFMRRGAGCRRGE